MLLTVARPCPPPRRLRLTACLALALALGGCGDKAAPPGASQVAVRVNSDEISVHQVNDILQRLTPPSAEALDQTRREILDKLVDQQLAAQQAIGMKLDRAPETILALEAAKREILARVYLEQVLSLLSKPTQNDVKKFFIEHPELFSQRRIYDLQEVQLTAPLPAAEADALRSLVGQASSLEQVIAWLKQRNDAKFSTGENTLPAEQLPLELLTRLHTMSDGQIGIFDTPQGTAVIRIVASRSEPIEETAALPQVQKFLENQTRQEAITREIKRLRDAAKIEYVGDYGKPASAKAAAPDLTHTLEKGVAELK